MNRQYRIHAATLAIVSCLLAVKAVAQVGFGCDDRSPAQGGVYEANVPLLVDYIPSSLPGNPTSARITFADESTSFTYFELAHTTTTLTLRFPGEYAIRRDRMWDTGMSFFCGNVFEVVQGSIPVAVPPTPQPPAEGIGPRLTIGGGGQYILAIDQYARHNPIRTFSNTGDSDLVIYDILPAVDNGRLQIWPLSFDRGTVLPPGATLHLDFDYRVLDPEGLRFNQIRNLPFAVLSNDTTTPTYFSGNSLTIVNTRDDIPPHITPVITLRPCESEQDANGDGMLDAADLLLRLLGAD